MIMNPKFADGTFKVKRGGKFVKAEVTKAKGRKIKKPPVSDKKAH